MKAFAKIASWERAIDRMLPPQEAAPSDGFEVPGLAEFIPSISVKYEIPEHLRPLIDLFERAARGEQVKAVVSMPPRHGKTETLIHGIAWNLAKNPSIQIAYLGATADFTRSKSTQARKLAVKAGVQISKETRKKSDWRTTSDQGGLWACGVGGQINGQGFNLIICDDPHKGRSEAESPTIRDKVSDWLKADALTRLEPGGSIIIVHTRWHPDDLIGRLLAQDNDWENVHLPAINEQGQALWPKQWPLAALLRQQDELGGPDGYDWCSLYQGQPKPEGTALFQGFYTYDAEPPLLGCRIFIGVDFGYSKKGDYSTAVVMAELDGIFYVLEVFREHVEPRTFRSHVQALSERYNNAPVVAYVAATEIGNVEFFREKLNVTVKRAVMDKLSNAIHVSSAWNTQKVLCPEKAPWLDAFLSEVKCFTGKGDRHDDQVDALAAAHDSLRLHSVDWEYLDRLGTAWPKPLSF